MESFRLSSFFRKLSPAEYMNIYKLKNNGSSNKAMPEIASHIFISGCIGLYISGIINLFEGNNNTVVETNLSGLAIGVIYGLLTCIFAVENLEEMDLDSKDIESRLELYPNIIIVYENKPVMTMNLAYRF